MKQLFGWLGLATLPFVFVFGIFAVLGAVLWTYTINAWLVFLGKAATVVWWQGALLGIVPYLGQFCIPAAFITFILMLILV